MSKIRLMVAAAVILAGIGMVAAVAQQPGAQVPPELFEQVVKSTWKSPAAGWQARIDQDETQRLCSRHRNAPPAAEFETILAREKATVVFPTDGHVLGDWRAGEKVAQAGTGGQFSDRDDTPRGGNCLACHQMSPQELSYGTLGPSLLGYGRIRKFSTDEARAAYGKVYNAQSVQPCSNMPRFGHHKFLTEQQIKDVTAYLFDPESPVNSR